MRVEAASNYLYTSPLRATERAREITASRAQEAATPQAVEDAPRAESSKPVDFSRMSRREMFDLLTQLKVPEEMPIESLGTIVLLTLHCADVDAQGNFVVPPKEDGVRSDRMQQVRDAMPYAKTRNDGGRFLRGLESVLSAMQRCQGQNVSVDTFA